MKYTTPEQTTLTLTRVIPPVVRDPIPQGLLADTELPGDLRGWSRCLDHHLRSLLPVLRRVTPALRRHLKPHFPDMDLR